MFSLQQSVRHYITYYALGSDPEAYGAGECAGCVLVLDPEADVAASARDVYWALTPEAL